MSLHLLWTCCSYCVLAALIENLLHLMWTCCTYCGFVAVIVDLLHLLWTCCTYCGLAALFVDLHWVSHITCVLCLLKIKFSLDLFVLLSRPTTVPVFFQFFPIFSFALLFTYAASFLWNHAYLIIFWSYIYMLFRNNFKTFWFTQVFPA